MNCIINIFKENKKFLFFIFFFSFLIRLLFFHFILSKDSNYFTADSVPYHQLALQVAQGKGIANTNETSQFYRLPGYSIFLALFYKLCDYNVNITLIIQILFSCLIPILVFILFLSLFLQNILGAKIASLYVAIHLGFVIFSGLVMSETLFVLFFLLFLIFFLKVAMHPEEKTKFSSRRIFWSGVFLGIASLIRPVGHYVILLSILLLIFLLPQRIKSSFLLFIGWFLIVVWWLLRNYLATGHVFFHTLPGSHFLNHSASYIVMNVQKVSYKDAKNKLLKELDIKRLKEEKRIGEALNEIENCILSEKLSFKYIKKHTFLFMKFSVGNILKTMFKPFFEEIFFIWEKRGCKGFTNNWFALLYYFELILSLIILFGFCGFIYNSFFSKDLFCVTLKVLPFICLFIFITLAAGFARLRLPIEPLIIVLSANFWSKVLKKRKWEINT